MNDTRTPKSDSEEVKDRRREDRRLANLAIFRENMQRERDRILADAEAARAAQTAWERKLGEDVDVAFFPPAKHQIGMPSFYTPELGRRICMRIAVAKMSLRKICQEPGFPSISTVCRWRHERPDFEAMYMQAREMQADLLVEETLEIADTPEIGEKTKIGPDGVEVTRGDMLEHRRLKIEVRKWLAAALRPRRYGSRVALEHGGTLAPTGSQMVAATMAAVQAIRSTSTPMEAALEYERLMGDTGATVPTLAHESAPSD